MEVEITKEEYNSAWRLIKAYERQEKNKKTAEYSGFTESNIVSNKFTNQMFGYESIAYWVVPDGKIPTDKNPDAIINLEPDFYTIEGGRIPYKTFEEAYKVMIKNFKRKKLIS
jgi:hypothetical protein